MRLNVVVLVAFRILTNLRRADREVLAFEGPYRHRQDPPKDGHALVLHWDLQIPKQPTAPVEVQDMPCRTASRMPSRSNGCRRLSHHAGLSRLQAVCP
jgi:hypothetical protein